MKGSDGIKTQNNGNLKDVPSSMLIIPKTKPDHVPVHKLKGHQDWSTQSIEKWGVKSVRNR